MALAVFAEAKQDLTARLRELVRALGEAEDYLNRSEPAEAASLLHHLASELRIRVSTLDAPLANALERLHDQNGHKRGEHSVVESHHD